MNRTADALAGCGSAVPRAAARRAAAAAPPRRGWSASPPAAPGWPSGCSKDLRPARARPASSPRPCTATISPGAACRRRRSRRSWPSTSTTPHIVLLDDVLYTGRTIRAVLNELFDYRPAGQRASWRCWSTAAGGNCRCRPTTPRRGSPCRPTQSLALARDDDGSFSFEVEATGLSHAVQAQPATQQERRTDPPAVDRRPAARHRHAHPRHRGQLRQRERPRGQEGAAAARQERVQPVLRELARARAPPSRSRPRGCRPT